MKYRGSGGGDFVKFEKVGDGVIGTVAGVTASPNKFKGTVDTVIQIQEKGTGAMRSVRCDKKALADAAAQITAAGGFRIGERIEVRFEDTYESKQFKNNPGKNVTIDLPDRDKGGAQPAPAREEGEDGDVKAAYAELVKAKGEKNAKDIEKAVKQVAKGDPAKQAELLRKAVAA